MAARKKKIRRANLRGWWKPLPVLLLPTGLFFIFSWLEAHRLQNEYEVIDLKTQIRATSREIDDLHDAHTELNRITAMKTKAPDLNMVKAMPEQVKILSDNAIREALHAIGAFAETVRFEPSPTHSVEYDLSPVEYVPDVVAMETESTP